MPQVFKKGRRYDPVEHARLMIKYKGDQLPTVVISNYNRSIANFKEKMLYNFNDLKQIYFCTLTIAVYGGPNKIANTEAIVRWGDRGEQPFKINRVSWEQGSDLDYVNKQWKLFIMRITDKYKIDTKKWKWVVVAEKQKHQNKGVWHFHFVSNKFLPWHWNCPIGRKNKKNQIMGCYKCNYKLAKVWKIGFCQKKEPEIKNARHFANYMSKYMAKTFEEVEGRKKAYRFSKACENVPTQSIKFVACQYPEYRKQVRYDGDLKLNVGTLDQKIWWELIENADYYKRVEVEIKSSIPSECFYTDKHWHKNKDCFVDKIVVYQFVFLKKRNDKWFTNFWNWLKSWQFRLIIERELKNIWAEDLSLPRFFYQQLLLQQQNFTKIIN